MQRTVYDSVHARLQDAVATIQKLEQKDRSGEEPGFDAVMDWFSSFSEALIAAKRVQVQALNAHDVSLSDYRWVCKQVFHAAGWAAPPLGVETAMGRSRAGLYVNRQKKPFEGSIPGHNRELVAPLRNTIDSLDIVARSGL